MLDLLVIATHPDDAEISVGGILLKAKSEGLKTGVLDLTSGEPTPYGTEKKRKEETSAATKVLRLDWRDNLGLPNRNLMANLDARREIANVIRRLRPKMILAPWEEDVHPDHVQASRLCDDARFFAKLSRTDMEAEPYWTPRLYYYLSIHLRNHPKPSVVVDISDQLDEKMKAVRCYHSQLIEGKAETFPTVLDDIRDRARYWGWSIHSGYGEPLISREEIAVTRIGSLFES